jgi:NAD(P)-dependent dehydrogenase (short-subunit alcohol dehydrogenase family)
MGFESTELFLAHLLLLEQIIASAPVRIVNVASSSHYRGKIHFNDINLEKGYNGWKAYSQSKLANVLFTYELVRRLGEKWVTANTLTPGFVATRIGHNTGPILKYPVSLVQKLGGKTPEEGAETITYLASSSEVAQVTGKFFRDKVAIKTSPISYNLEIAQRLWEISELMTHI